MELSDTQGKRFEVALWAFKNQSERLQYRGLAIFLCDDGSVGCSFPSSYLPDNQTELRAREDFATAKELFAELLEASSELAAFVRDRKVRYSLYHGPERGDVVSICTLDGDAITWHSRY